MASMEMQEILDQLLKMTWYNPVFMMVLIGSIWFVPGLIIRRITEDKIKKSQIKDQDQKIARLYPKEID
tara:strand:+ start:290 stop:496 length:207 start_codon:yes stop_codon:yes gene_type:complete